MPKFNVGDKITAVKGFYNGKIKEVVKSGYNVIANDFFIYIMCECCDPTDVLKIEPENWKLAPMDMHSVLRRMVKGQEVTSEELKSVFDLSK